MIVEQWEIPRSELDELAVRSNQRAAKATEDGCFEREIVPMRVNGDTYATDQGVRPQSTLDVLAELKRRSSRTAGSPRATPRRSPTAPQRCCSCRPTGPASLVSPRARLKGEATAVR